MPSRTPLYDVHVRSGARMVEFAGWEMPVQYAGILEEHEAVRKRVGLFDVSHMGEVVFRGAKALEALNRLFTNDLGKVSDGQAQYGCVCRENGGIVDDVVVYRRSVEDLLVCVNAGNRTKDFEWLKGHAQGADVSNESDDWAQLALQGPLAAKILQRLTRSDLAAIKTYRFAPGEVAGIACRSREPATPARTASSSSAAPIGGRSSGTRSSRPADPRGSCPAGSAPGTRCAWRWPTASTARDMDDGTTPLEAGLAWVVKLGQGRLHRPRRAAEAEGGRPAEQARRLRPHRAGHRAPRLPGGPGRPEGRRRSRAAPSPRPSRPPSASPTCPPALAAEGSTFGRRDPRQAGGRHGREDPLLHASR